MTDVLVTGANGYIGAQLTRALRARSVRTVAADAAFPATTPENVAVDLRDAKAAMVLLQTAAPHLIFHCGTHSALAYRDRFATSFDDDYCGLRNLLDGLENNRGCRIVTFSSSYVYSGLPAEIVVTESAPLAPRHPFGVAKVFFEHYLLRQHANAVIFRLSSVFGPGNALQPNAVTEMIRECLAARRVTVWGEGRRMMQYIFTEDVVRAALSADRLVPGIYNLGGDEYVSVRAAAEKVAALLSGMVKTIPDTPEGESLPRMDTARLRTTGFAATPLAAGLQETVAWAQRQRVHEPA